MYRNDFIYDWNIDGLFEHEIFNVLRQMSMASTAYLTDGDDHNAVVDPAFFAIMRFPLKRRDSFFFI